MHIDHAFRPSTDEIRCAILWALDHDRAALVEHRTYAHLNLLSPLRRAADARLVRRWLEASAVSSVMTQSLAMAA
ncbi:hypothetical protein H9623_05365 [Oerskovia sp. Sa1BUA8]|uniref:Uncharacterized protein n=1 Tax=Oerskovia douganii TaxID=2762210 RepID=A0A9D5U740_9CELL|nr:hypothetical protein [Oerskovia douganii]MBE7699738.1 hypothetical protein [Oerskovia douganii]